MIKRLYYAGVALLAVSILFSFGARGAAENLFGVTVNKLSFAEGETLVLTVSNRSFDEVITGYDYRILAYVDGEWVQVMPVDAVPAVAASLRRFDSFTQEIDLRGLTPGEYVLVKEICKGGETHTYHFDIKVTDG
ncbi:hypothetical protein JXL21_02160 [Candidatus Bathyarchaeota archaeon]|nr:hypothetical protein [Candidatus Bathyarchaeota archaeon]